jgi:hypothetical protein
MVWLRGSGTWYSFLDTPTLPATKVDSGSIEQTSPFGVDLSVVHVHDLNFRRKLVRYNVVPCKQFYRLLGYLMPLNSKSDEEHLVC